MKTILYFILVFTGLTYFQSFGQNLSGNNNETITGQWTFTNPNGAAITVDHSNKPSNGPSGGIRVIPSVRQWDTYFTVSHPNFSNRLFALLTGNGGINSDSWFPCIETRVMSDYPAFYINAQQYGPTNKTHPIIVLDARKPGGVIPITQPLVAIGNGFSNYKVKFLVDGTIETVGGGYFLGNVGIGTTATEHKLDVAGTIRATEIKVEAQTADFVFEDDYNLRSLAEVENFIKENKHLPDIPSASQMEAEGVNLAEMNKLLLMKVEELTLYLIQQQKLIDKLLENK